MQSKISHKQKCFEIFQRCEKNRKYSREPPSSQTVQVQWKVYIEASIMDVKNSNG